MAHVVVAALLLLPGAGATWYVAGTFEPDTAYDSAAWMFAEPAPPGASRIYFQVVTTTAAGVGVSPNVGTLATRNEAPTSEQHLAILGVWKDCNRDGYVGAAEHALREYSAAILSESSVCPPVTGPITLWRAGAHNYNGWVSELIPIAYQPDPSDRRNYRDDEAMIWGDHGRPDAPPPMAACMPTDDEGVVPEGALQNSGLFLNFVACHLEQLGVQPWAEFDAALDAVGDPLGLRFDDAHDARSGALGQMETFGDEPAEESPVYVWDCSTGTAEPDPSVNDLDSRSVAALFNHTYEGTRFVEDCDPSSDYGHEFYGLVEAEESAVDPRNKTQPQWTFDYHSATRGGAPLGAALGPGQSGVPADVGVGWTVQSTTMSGWFSSYIPLGKLGPAIARVDLDAGSAQLADARWYTFYATLGRATLDRGFERPPNDGERYGEWACGADDTGVRAGWNCDPAMWYTRTDGAPAPLPSHPVPRVGQTYLLRDVDCYDGGNAAGVALGPAWYGAQPCP